MFYEPEHSSEKPSAIDTMLSGRAAKAYVAGTVAGLSAAIAVADKGFTVAEMLGIASAFVIGFQTTFWTTNK